MTAQTHTPGPWRVLGLNGGYEPTIASAGDVFIACTQHPASEDEDLANARLIAAAPELLAAVEFALEVSTMEVDSQEKALAIGSKLASMLVDAVTKAKGL